MPSLLFALIVLLLTAFGLAQLIAGFDGLQHYMGTILALITLLVCGVTRFTLPITIGSFLGAMVVWGWPWYWAALFAAPGLALLLPGIAITIASISRPGYWRKKPK